MSSFLEYTPLASGTRLDTYLETLYIELEKSDLFCVFKQLKRLIFHVNMIVVMAPISQAGQNAENDAFKKRAIWVELGSKIITCVEKGISLSSSSLSARLGSFLCIFPLTFRL